MTTATASPTTMSPIPVAAPTAELITRSSGNRDVANLAMVAATTGALAVVKETGEFFHKSGMFGAKTPAQGYVLALECYITGQRPSTIANENMIAFDRIVRKYEMMLADLRQAGGDFEWLTENADAEIAILQIAWRGRTHTFTFTMDMAKRAKIVKPGGGWETWPYNMLRSKAVRGCLQMYAPEVLKGALTPEDAEDIAVVEPQAPAVPRKPRANRAAEIAAMDAEAVGGGPQGGSQPTASTETIIDAEVTPVATMAEMVEEPPFVAPVTKVATPAPAVTSATVQAAATSAAPTALAGNSRMTPEQARKLVNITTKLGVPWEKYEAGCKTKFGVAFVGDMTVDQANALTVMFEEKLAARAAAAGNP